ncbi:interferon-induced very large GTPase 1-like [Aplochiton taeniatus]
MPKDALDSIKRLNTANTEGFVKNLTEFVKDMEQSLAAEYDKDGNIPERLRSLPFKPQDQMFKDLFGCGKQCPFCGVVCEAGGEGHKKHFSKCHRPIGFNKWHDRHSKRLVTDICTSCVTSDMTYSNVLTKGWYHPYKHYRKHYPDWEITGDTSLTASDYWKYVMATFNKEIAADNMGVLPADIPEDWKTITPEDAMKSLKNIFNME